MLTRDPTLPIRMFHLKCGTSPGCDPHDINRFVPVAVKKGIENLILDFTGTSHDFLIRLGPTFSSVFNCGRNLVVLKLKFAIVNVVAQFDFPLLKTLHLAYVYFFGDHTSDFNKLFVGCPILEDLQISNVQFLLSNRCDGGEFKGLSNLVRADISNRCWNMPFSWICNAKFLRVILSKEQQVHNFHNLTCMELIFGSSWCTKWKWVLELLEHCPKLQNLTLDEVLHFYRAEDDWKEPAIVPKCISSQLRTCSLKAHRGRTYELQFAEYIMKNATGMHTMTISGRRLEHQMLLKLSSCPRGSATCKLSFEFD
ncbi:F-box/RNI/FBD-like domain protein [Medicago truncatula]|uniref:F-box/RNI/FBD-like domain protein n=3 Tax=Medicago truncatula TaxID=3880 RepID=A0A072U8K8_MEDTR|nr:F-box/RNI/FBD-like domain protein [Medicago truncatula]